MKRLLQALGLSLIVLISSSCQTGTGRYGYGDGRTPEEIQLSLEILLSDSFSMAPGLIDTRREEITALLPEALSDYRGVLPLYDELEHAYVLSTEKGMKDAVLLAIGLFEEQKVAIPYTWDYIAEKDMTGYLEETAGETVRKTIEGKLHELFPDMWSAWERLETECTILKKNYENLSTVTDMPELSAPERISDEALSSFIVSEALDAIRFAEEYLRNRPMTEHTERSYQIFWEEY